MGSVAEKVLRSLSVPVLMIHPIEVTERDRPDWNEVYDKWEDYSDQAKKTWGRLTDAEQGRGQQARCIAAV